MVEIQIMGVREWTSEGSDVLNDAEALAKMPTKALFGELYRRGWVLLCEQEGE